MSLLNNFLKTMSASHREALKKIMKDEDIALSRVDRELLEYQLNNLIENIDKESSFSLKPIIQTGKLKSSSYNLNMEQIETDLRIIFFISGQIDQYISNYYRLTTSEMQALRKSISDIKKQLKRFKLLSGKEIPFSEYVYESFEFPEYHETDEVLLESLGIGRSGEEYKKENAAEIRAGKLSLASIRATNQIKTRYGRPLADIHVSRRNGYVEVMPGHEIEKAFDSSEDRYWAENLIVDTPILGSDNIEWARDLETSNLQGAIAEIEIRLHNVSTVSEIHFNPFGFYPVEVISIVGYQNSEFGGERYELVKANHENQAQRSKSSTNNMIFKFPSVDIGSMRIVIRQETFNKENFIINENHKNIQDIWMDISSHPKTMPDTISQHESIEDFNKKLESSDWMKYLSQLDEWAIENEQEYISQEARKLMNIVRSGDFNSGSIIMLQGNRRPQELPKKLEQPFKAVSKTSYLYGAKNIEVYGRKYKESSVYVSKKLDLSINIKKLSLQTKEEHEFLKNKETGERSQITDIEYYITGKKNPTPEEWEPILPVGQIVESERLIADNIGGNYPELSIRDAIYSLRFQAISKGSITVFRNGYIVPEDYYVVSDDLRKISIKKEYYVPTSIYTAKYQPTDEAYTFDISKDDRYIPSQYVDENGQNGEVFHDVVPGEYVTLKNTPLISRDNVLMDEDSQDGYFQNDEFINSGAIDYPVHVWADGVKLINVTKYDSGTYDPEDLKKNDGNTFAQIGKKIILGDINGGYKNIEVLNVDYRYIVTDVRLKAILRRNTLNTDSVSPSLIEYNVRAETNDLEDKGEM